MVGYGRILKDGHSVISHYIGSNVMDLRHHHDAHPSSVAIGPIIDNRVFGQADDGTSPSKPRG